MSSDPTTTTVPFDELGLERELDRFVTPWMVRSPTA